jgi:hypothetical protein
MAVLRITKWETSFETSESRKYLALSWIALPISFSSNGYQSLLDEFGDEAAAAYGAWCALCSFAATCEIRGVLATSRGVAVKTSHIARTTGFPSKLFDRLIDWASSSTIGWLSTVSDDEFSRLLAAKEAAKEEAKNKKRKRDGSQTEDSSGEIPEDREKNTSTLHNPTLPNDTKPNVTQHHTTSGPGPNRGQASVNELATRWKSQSLSFLVLVEEIAKRFGRLPEKVRFRDGQEIDRAFIWQMAWVGAEFDRAVVDGICEELPRKGDPILKPRSYCDSIMRSLCTRNGHEWNVLRGLVPPAPPPPSKVAVLEEAIA